MENKRYTKDFKDQLVQEAKESGNASIVANRHGVNVKTLYSWITSSKHKAWEKTNSTSKKTVTYTPSPQEFKSLENENDKLKILLGEKDLEIAILRDLLKKTNPGYRTR